MICCPYCAAAPARTHENDIRPIAEIVQKTGMPPEDWAMAFARREHMPSFEFMKQRIADQLGGQPDEHTPLALALVALLHGTATLLLPASAREKHFRDFRQACLLACEVLIAGASGKNRHATHRPAGQG